MRQILFFLIFMLLLGCNQASAADPPHEDKVKAAYLYNFAKFVHWPESAFEGADAPLVIGVFGNSDFAKQLEPLKTRSVRSRSIEIKNFSNMNDLQACHLLYVDAMPQNKLKAIFATLTATALLTVGEDKDFADLGGTIQFVTLRDRLRFIINLDAAKARQIQIDAQLLSLATEVLENDK